MTMHEDIAVALVSYGPGEDSNSLFAKFRFSEDLEVFKGHFPRMPLLPGVLQFEMVRFVLERSTETSYRIRRIKKAKFIGPIQPGLSIKLAMVLENQSDFVRVKAKLSVDERVVSSLIIELESAN